MGAAVAMSVGLAGCASMRPAPDPGLDTLYTQMQEAADAYEGAREAARQDPGQAAEQAQAQARLTLQQQTNRCADAAGCDMQRVVALYDHLLQADITAPADEADDTQDNGQDAVVDAVVPQSQRTVTLLHGHHLSDLIAMNGPVKSALEEWLTWRRPQLMRAYVNYQYLRPLMWPPFHKAGLPEAVLFGIVAKESGGKVHAVSRSGAKGPMQFMYHTGKRFGLKVVDGFDQRFDPRLSSRAAGAYINEQLKVFNDNLELVLAAYNGGEGRVRRLVDGRTSISFYDPAIYFDLPSQTRRYVPLVLAAAWLFMHPDRYHLDFPKINARMGQVKLARPASLSELSICLGQDEGVRDGWFRTLRNLNPRLDPQQEQAAGTRIHVPAKLEAAYVRDCASGHWADLATDLHSGAMPTQPSGLPRHYVVRSGDTLSGIVRELGCSSVREVARLNDLRRPRYAIRIGQRLTLPRCY